MLDYLKFQNAITLFIFFNFIVLYRTVLSERVAQMKCKEYAKLVFHSEESPVLRIDFGPKNVVSKCGIVETPLIVGGIKAKPMEFPHMATIGYGKGIITWQCGGSIISENYILTAAHCMISPMKGPASKVRAGLINLKKRDFNIQERNVIERIMHPEYKMPTRYNDIALLKLDRPLYFNAYVRPACLEIDPIEKQHINKKVTFIASGFGKTSYEATTGSDDLMKVTLDYVKPEICAKNFLAEIGGRQMPEGITSSMICAGILEGGKDTCQGDSGGPLQRVLREPYCMYSIVGLTSFGKFCAFKDSPAIYTRVNSYLDWIENIVWS